MSDTQEIAPLLAELADFVHAPRGKEILGEIERIVGVIDRQTAFRVMRETPTPEAIDRLELLTQDQFIPYPGQESSYRTDMKRYFQLLRMSLGQHPAAFDEIFALYPETFPFGGKAKSRCAALRSTCIESTEHDEHRFESPDQLLCPVCGTPRTLCKKAPRSNGRCVNHGGRSAPSQRMTRGMIYRDRITDPETQRIMERIEQDADAVSLVPEIGLLATRVAGLIDQIEGGIDSRTILKQMTAISKRVNQALDNDAPERAMAEIRNIMKLLESKERTEGLWSDVLETIKVLGTQADRERKRMAMEKQMIPIERALRLQDETIEQIHAALSAAAYKLSGRFIHLVETQILAALPVPERMQETIINGLHDRRKILTDGVIGTYEHEIDKFMATREENLSRSLPHAVTINEVPEYIEGELVDETND